MGRDSDSSNDLMAPSVETSLGARRRNSKSMVGVMSFREEIADRTPSRVLFAHSFCDKSIVSIVVRLYVCA